MLLPKRVKYRRVHRGRMTGKALRGNKVTYGDFGLQATEPAWITSNQIEAARVAMTRYCKRFGKVWIKIFPDKPVTAKPACSRCLVGKKSLFGVRRYPAPSRQMSGAGEYFFCRRCTVVCRCDLLSRSFGPMAKTKVESRVCISTVTLSDVVGNTP